MEDKLSIRPIEPNKDASTIHNIDGVEYETISVNPPENSYFNSNIYYLPKKQF